jgi:hypothetical protein
MKEKPDVLQGTLYPLLLKLEQEGSIASEPRLSSRAFSKSKQRTCHEIPTPLFRSPLELHHRKARRSARP